MAAASVNEAQKAFLANAARRYIWWETADYAMACPQKILAQVMNIGLWDDVCKLAVLFEEKDLIEVLDTSDVGQFNERSWHFWHNRFTGKVPPMPERVLP